MAAFVFMRDLMTGGRRRIVRGSIALLLALSASVGLAQLSSASPSKNDVERAKAQLEAMNQRLSLLDEQLNQARLAMQEVEGKLAETRAAAEKAAAAAEEALATLNVRAAKAYQGFGSQISMLLGAESLADFSDRLEFIGSLAQSDSDLATEAAHAQQQARWTAEELQKTLEARQAALESLQTKEQELRNAAAEQLALYTELDRKYHDALQAEREAQAAAAAAAAIAASASSASIQIAPPGPPPPINGSGAAAAIAAARAVIGTPYVFGSADPNVGFDCSGLTMWAWANGGVSLPHSSAAQYAVLPHVDRDSLQPGDLVFFYSPIHHVGLYVGGGMMIDAPHTGTVVQQRPVEWNVYVGAARP